MRDMLKNKIPHDHPKHLHHSHSFHGKIDWDVAKRLLGALYSEGSLRKTNLAMKAGINYSACSRYVAWMAEISWVRIEESNRVTLEQSGLQVCGRVLENQTASSHTQVV